VGGEEKGEHPQGGKKRRRRRETGTGPDNGPVLKE